MNHTVEFVDAVEFDPTGMKVGRRFTVKIDDIIVKGIYTLPPKPNLKNVPAAEVNYNKWSYRLRLEGGWSKHPDYKDIRFKVLDCLGTRFRTMSKGLWRIPLESKTVKK